MRTTGPQGIDEAEVLRALLEPRSQAEPWVPLVAPLFGVTLLRKAYPTQRSGHGFSRVAEYAAVRAAWCELVSGCESLFPSRTFSGVKDVNISPTVQDRMTNPLRHLTAVEN